MQARINPISACVTVGLGLFYPALFLQALHSLNLHESAAGVLVSFGAGYVLHAVLLLILGLAVAVVNRAAGIRAAPWAASILIVAAGTGWLFFGPAPIVSPPKEVFAFKIAVGIVLLGGALILSRSNALVSALQFSKYCAGLGGIASGIALIVLLFVSQHSNAKQEQNNQRLKGGDVPPLVIWISIDAFSALHADLYGYSRRTTPSLDELASRSFVFDRAYANSNFTTCSFASLLRSQRPWTHRQLQQESRPFSDSSQGLISTLARAGFRIVVAGSNPYASAVHHGVTGLVDSSFDSSPPTARLATAGWVESIGIDSAILDIGIPHYIVRIADLISSHVLEAGKQFDPAAEFSFAREMLSVHKDERATFLWVHLFPPHDPYVAPAPYVGIFDGSSFGRRLSDSMPEYAWRAYEGTATDNLQARYDENVRFVDSELGSFLKWLHDEGIYDNAYIFVNADHGESFHFGYGGHGGPLLSEELIRIPMIIKVPGQSTQVHVSTLTEQIDFAPTVLELLGLSIPDTMEGTPLLTKTIDGKVLVAAPARPIFAMNFEQSSDWGPLDTGSVAMLSLDNWKYVTFRGRINYPNQPQFGDELFDLAADPQESTNLVAQFPDVAAQMRRTVDLEIEVHGKRVPLN